MRWDSIMDTKRVSRLSPGLYVGLDVGGTFTDPGVLDALELFAVEHETTLEDLLARVGSFGHGTTQATNVLVQRDGARTALITTRGFKDTIFIQRLPGFTAGGPDELLGFYSARRQPDPVVPRALVYEVPERVDQAGAVLLALDESAARTAIEQVVAGGGRGAPRPAAWSPRNPAHELRIRELAAEIAPELPVSLSHEIAPVVGEDE